jgi:iron complex outermembrane recepter protein
MRAHYFILVTSFYVYATTALAQHNAEPEKIEAIIITATPTDKQLPEMAQPATALKEDDLRRKRAASIGDTLSQELGVHSSSFGSGSGRPIIRGLDGARIRVMENGIGTMDASTISPDHAVTTDSLKAKQIEILRGPASLLYGSGAIGGVVNVVSDLIPKFALGELESEVESRFGSHDFTASADMSGGSDSVAWHLHGYNRSAGNYPIPGAGKFLPNSFTDGLNAGSGLSWVGSRGHLGFGIEGLENKYGIPTDEGVSILQKQTRMDISGELNQAMPIFKRLKFRFGQNRYAHNEIESDGAIATRFNNQAWETRLEAQHQAIAGWSGAVGLQLQRRDIAAIGEESIIPRTVSHERGVFLVEEKKFGTLNIDWGARVESADRRPLDGVNPKRDYTLYTTAAGLLWKFAPDHNISINLTQGQRAPSVEELYSNGAHPATATFDIGNNALNKETARNIDLTLRSNAKHFNWKLNLFGNRISDYVYAKNVDLNADGVADRVDDAGSIDAMGEFLLQETSQADARFVGAEAEIAYRPDEQGIGARVFADSVRGRLSAAGNLPRISPARVGLELDYLRANWSGNLTWIHGFKQNRVAELETVTDGYNRVNAEISYRFGADKKGGANVFIKGSNLLDEDIRLHTSYLKLVTPQQGRYFQLGFRGEF